MRLSTRFALTMTAVVTLLVVTISSYLIRAERRKLTQEMERQALVLTATITLGIDSATFLERRDLLLDYFDKLVPQSGGQVLYILVTDLNGLAWIDTLKEREYQRLDDPVTRMALQRLKAEPQVLQKYAHPDLREEVLEVATPIVGNQMERGILRIGFSLKPLERQIRRAIVSSVAVGLIALAAGTLLSIYLSGGVVKPIGRLVAYARAVSEGNLQTVPHQSKTREMEELARSIERMKRDLKYIYIGGLFADLSHALKSDLGYLYSELEQLRSRGESVAGMRDRLDRITGELQKYRRFQKPTDVRRVKLDSTPFLTRFVQGWISTRKDLLDVQIAAGLPSIWADPVYLERALSHLMKNAEEASPPGSSVSLKAVQKNGQLVIEIADKGPGIPVELQSRIFDIGFTTKRDRGGNGLGLSLTKMILEDLHEGEIRVVSEAGRGTSMRLAFPCREPVG